MSSKLRSIKRAGERAIGKEAEDSFEVTYQQLINAMSAGAVAALLNERLPGRLMQLVRFGKSVTGELELFEEAKKKIIERHDGKLDEQKKVYEFDGNTEAADKDFQELLRTTVTIRGPRLTEAELDKTNLVPAQVMMLSWLVE